jgi:hypothetical protein
MNKKNKLKDLIVNDKSDKNIGKPEFSEKLKKVISGIISNIYSIDNRVHKLEILGVDTSVDKLKPIDAEVKDTKKPKDISKALHTKLSSKQKTNIRRGDSVADILAGIFQSMNESRLEMIKSSELKRNFADEHIKERKRKINKKKITYKKHRLKKDKFNITGLLTMGLIVNFGDIVKWATSLVEPFTNFIDNIKSEFQNFDIGKKTEQLAEVISSFISDMKTSLLQGIDNFLNTWVEELLSWIEKTSGFIKFDREDIPRSNLSGSGYRTPEGDKTTEDMVKDKESGMPTEEFNKKYNTSGTSEPIPTETQPAGKMSSAIVTEDTERKMEEKRSIGDRVENALNKTASVVGTVAKGAAGVAGHLAGTVLSSTAKDVMPMIEQTGRDLSARSKQTYKNITSIEKTPEETKLYEQQQSEYRQTHKPGMFGPIEIPKNEQKIKSTNPIVDKINAPEVTPLTTPSVEYNNNQNKNNNLVIKNKTTTSTSTTPAKTINMGGSQSSVSPGNPATCRNGDKTLNHIGSSNICKV